MSLNLENLNVVGLEASPLTVYHVFVYGAARSPREAQSIFRIHIKWDIFHLLRLSRKRTLFGFPTQAIA